MSDTEFWNARRTKLQDDLRKAALDLFAHTGSAAFQIDLDPPHEKLLLIAGAPGSIMRRLDETGRSAIALLHRAVNGPWTDGDLARAREILGANKE